MKFSKISTKTSFQSPILIPLFLFPSSNLTHSSFSLTTNSVSAWSVRHLPPLHGVKWKEIPIKGQCQVFQSSALGLGNCYLN